MAKTHHSRLLGIGIEDIYAKIVETSEESICVIDPFGKIIYVNESICRHLGWDQEKIIGTSVLELLTDEGAAVFQSQQEKRSAGKLREQYELAFFNSITGKVVYGLVSVNPLFNKNNEMVASMGFLANITPMKLMQMELTKTVSHLKKAQSLARVGFWEQDLKTGEVSWSNELYELLGVSKTETSPTPEDFYKCVHPEDRERLIQMKDKLDQGGGDYHNRYRFNRPDGKMIYLSSIVEAEKDSDGHVIRLHGVLQDISEQVQNDLLIQEQRAKMLNSAKLSALGEMAGGIAHEINNPLTAIQLRVEHLLNQLQSGQLDKDKALDALKSVQNTTNRITKIIKGLHTFSRKTDSEPFTRVSLNEILENTFSFCVEKFRSYGISVMTQSLDPQMMIECHPVQISQVLLNLLNNAFDAIEHLPEKWIRLEVRDQEDCIKIIVTDSGRGIAESDREKIFQPFFTTKDVGRGTGLGLSVSKGLAELNGGTLSLEPLYPNTRFILQLPKRQVGQAAA